MSGRTVVRVLAAVGLAALAVAVGVYFMNPLRTASHDPRLRLAGYAPFRNASRAMQPALRQNAIVIVSAWAYRNADPTPGDVVAFHHPPGRSAVFLKRVIASGGSTVEIVDGVTMVDGKPLDEPYVDPVNKATDYSRRMSLVRVPASAFFVMGDNRDASDDSRSWGSVPRSQVLGRVDSLSAPGNRARGP